LEMSMRSCLVLVALLFSACIHAPPALRTDAAPALWNEQPLAPSALVNEVRVDPPGAAAKFARKLIRVRGKIAAVHDASGYVLTLEDEDPSPEAPVSVSCPAMPRAVASALAPGQVVSVVGVAEATNKPSGVVLRGCDVDSPAVAGPAVANWNEVKVSAEFEPELAVSADDLARAYADDKHLADAEQKFGSRLLLVTGNIRPVAEGTVPLTLETNVFMKSITCQGVYTWMALDQVDPKRPVTVRGHAENAGLTGVYLRDCALLSQTP
jgi:hypothetical protein